MNERKKYIEIKKAGKKMGENEGKRREKKK